MVVGFGGAVTVTIVAPRNGNKMVAVFGVQNKVVDHVFLQILRMSWSRRPDCFFRARPDVVGGINAGFAPKADVRGRHAPRTIPCNGNRSFQIRLLVVGSPPRRSVLKTARVGKFTGRQGTPDNERPVQHMTLWRIRL